MDSNKDKIVLITGGNSGSRVTVPRLQLARAASNRARPWSPGRGAGWPGLVHPNGCFQTGRCQSAGRSDCRSFRPIRLRDQQCRAAGSAMVPAGAIEEDDRDATMAVNLKRSF
jgi:hypothetical protein